MMAECVYDEAEPFQMYSPAPSPAHPQRDVYSNSTELNLTEYSYCVAPNSDEPSRICDQYASVSRPNDRLDTTDRDQEQDDRSSRASWDGASLRQEPVEEMEVEKKRSDGETCDDSWNVRLRKNWRRHVRRRGAAGNDQKYKKSDNRQSIGGSLSR